MEDKPVVFKQKKRYISGIHFLVSSSEVKSTSEDFIPQDLNQGSLGKYIYGFKEWTQEREEAITEFKFIQNFQEAGPGFVKIDVDLNKGAQGAWNYLCIRKGEGPRVIDVDIVAFDKAFKFPIYGEWQVFPQDLNTGAKYVGKYIYLMYKTE